MGYESYPGARVIPRGTNHTQGYDFRVCLLNKCHRNLLNDNIFIYFLPPGVPAIIMAVTLGTTYRPDNPLGYRQEEFCWLAAVDKKKQFDFRKPMFWAFLLPVALILIYNVALLVLASLTICRTDTALKSSRPRTLWKKFLISFSLAVLLGVSWSLGYLVLVTSGNTNLVFSVLFCVCTTTQGFQIFVLFTARTPSFRAVLSRSLQFVSSVNIQLKETKYRLQRTWGTSSIESYRDISL
ncbi:probable G-protein coupled receptor 128 [Notothenia coriiceps]|uniref:Probable G-protein coupled receptor 128 n=1 Tax=Notothenia coriiceps TaxID=8208 RepID=A0A6I9MSK1_9TELE|nr:PREDICTED: probable G-protein coupled receptor 128 [Notothenia coriiceps]XP_010769150.1 PREDICTED: probable G-protein coupled receptor 128 [Notothenia coriiceps]